MGQEEDDNQNEDKSAVDQLEEQSSENSDEGIVKRPKGSKVLDKFTGRTQPSPTRQSIMNQDVTGETGALPYSTYFPGMENNINKGYYSGSMVGSNPIYAPSGLYPFGMIDAHRQALARAADAKVAEQDAWAQRMTDASKAPETKRKAVQQTMQNDFYNGISEYKNKFLKDNPNFQGDVNKALMRDPGFNQYLSDQHTRFQMEDEGVNTIAKNQTESEKPGKILFSPQKQDMADFMSGKIDNMMSSTDPAVRAQAKAVHDRLAQHQIMNDPQKVLADFKKSNDPDDIESLQGVTPKQTYDMITTGSTKGIKNPAAAQRIVSGLGQLYDTEYGGREDQTGITKQQFINEGINQYGTTKKITVQTPSNKESGTGNPDDQKIHVQISKDDAGQDVVMPRSVSGKQLSVTKGGNTYSINQIYPSNETGKTYATGTRSLNKDEIAQNKVIEGENKAREGRIATAQIDYDKGDLGDKEGDGKTKLKEIEEQNAPKEMAYPETGVNVKIPYDVIHDAIEFNQKKEGANKKSMYNLLKGDAPEGWDVHDMRSETPSAPQVHEASNADWINSGWTQAQIDEASKAGKIKVK